MTDSRYDPDSLARRLDDVLPPAAADAPAGDPDPLVDTATQLARMPQPHLSAEALARIRGEVLAAQPQRPRRRPRLPMASRLVAVLGLVMLFIFFEVTSVALASVPGDSLYPLKQFIERVETLTAARSVEARALTHLLHADRRVQEARELVSEGQVAAGLFGAALAEMASAADLARDPALRDQLATRTGQITLSLSDILEQAQRSPLIAPATLAPVLTEVRATQDSGDLLLPSASPTGTPSPTATKTATATATVTPPATATATASPTMRPTLTATPRPPTMVPTLTPIPPTVIQVAPEEPAWSEDADCSNPPPPHAPAPGWRARCEGAPAPPESRGGGPPDDPGPPDNPGGGPPDDPGPPGNPGGGPPDNPGPPPGQGPP